MDFHLLRHRKLTEVLAIPDGLEDLMADIAREVLRYQPTNVECFIADYLEAMVLTRELMHVAERTIDDILGHSMQVELLVSQAGIPVDEAMAVVKVAEEEFRKQNSLQINEATVVASVIAKCKLSVEQAKKITSIVEDSWRHFFTQNLGQSRCPRTNPQVLDASAVRNTLLFHQKRHKCRSKSPDAPPPLIVEGNENWITENFQRRENAAIVIQSWFRDKKRALAEERAVLTIQTALRGFRERRQFERKRHQSAVVIQRSFRNYRARKGE